MDSGEVLEINRSARTWQYEEVESPGKLKFGTFHRWKCGRISRMGREDHEFCEGQEGVSRTEVDILV